MEDNMVCNPDDATQYTGKEYYNNNDDNNDLIPTPVATEIIASQSRLS